MGGNCRHTLKKIYINLHANQSELHVSSGQPVSPSQEVDKEREVRSKKTDWRADRSTKTKHRRETILTKHDRQDFFLRSCFPSPAKSRPKQCFQTAFIHSVKSSQSVRIGVSCIQPAYYYYTPSHFLSGRLTIERERTEAACVSAPGKCSSYSTLLAGSGAKT